MAINTGPIGQRRLEYEIRFKRNAILDALDRRDEHPSTARVMDIRNDLFLLQGMVYAYFYMTGRWAHNTHLELNEETNSIIMLSPLSIDLVKMRDRAYNKPKTRMGNANTDRSA